MIFYYSGCGNSRWAAEMLASSLNDELRAIPDELNTPMVYQPDEEERVGFVFPVYAWAPAPIVLEFVERMKLKAAKNYIYMVCTCGDETGYTEKIFAKALRRKGLTLKGAASVIMPETYINLPGFKLDTPQNERRKLDEARLRLGELAAAVVDRRLGSDMTVGSMPGLKSYPVRWLFNHVLISEKPFGVNDSCVGCGVCARVCPIHNIRMQDDRPVWGPECMNCMACYHHCPQNAIHYGKQTDGKGQYYCKEKV